jgi:feruloyl esterase
MKIALFLLAALPAAAATCGSLASLSLPHTTIQKAEAVTGTFAPPAGRPMANLPAFCRVAGKLTPSSDSDIRFEVWLPEKWNGKFEGAGNGGFAGAINYTGLETSVRAGYAAASTDTGHEAGGTDARWALGHPEKVTDFGYRAIHETAVAGKAIAKAYYGSDAKHAYFNSCSNGGRQALMEAQRFPEDYDGIVAGAPANYWTHLLSNAIWVVQATMGQPGSYIPPAKLPAIEAAALAACDAKDGVKDGVIDSPDRCGFQPQSLLCKGAEADSCLTAAQVRTLEKILGGIPAAGREKTFPGFVVGGMPGGNGWGGWITGGAPGQSLAFAFGTNYFKYLVFDAGWDWHSFQPIRDMHAADEKTAKALNATEPDLSRFQARGGKLILYHGWSDAAISPLNAIEYYRSVQAKMGAKSDGFVRLFMVPGMQHCGGGPGPNVFGQGGEGPGDPARDINAALERWVEGGPAPASIVATRFRSPGVVERTRPLCPYPQTAQYKGSGSTDEAANFVCR